MSAPVAPPAAVRPPRRRWLRWSLILLLVFIGLPAGYYWYARWTLERELAEVIAETDRLDPRWRLEDIEADRKMYADEENSAVHIMKVARLIGRRAPSAHKDYQQVLGGLSSEVQLNVQQVEMIREAFEKIPEELAEARKLIDIPHGRFPLRFVANTFEILLDDQQGSRTLADLLYHDALLRAQDGDPNSALESCQAILSAASAFGDEPFVLSFLIRMAIDAFFLDAVERVVAQGNPSELCLKDLQDRLQRERTDVGAHWHNAARGQRALNHQVFLALHQGRLSLHEWSGGAGPEPSWLQQLPGRFDLMRRSHDFPRFMLKTNELVTATKLAPEQQADRFQAVDEALARERIRWYFSPPPLGYFLRAHASLVTCEAGLACERFRLAHKRWPESLAELVRHKLLGNVPLDPFDGQPLRLIRRKDGITIYSIGHDKKDNGGTINRDRPTVSGIDLGFRLWEPAKRRQPPQPPVVLRE